MSLTSEQFEKLLSKIGGSRPASTLAQCTAKYDGSRNSAVVETFLAAVKVFMKLERISDADAIIGLPLVLSGDAAIWWQGVKGMVKSWADFETRLRDTFAPRKMAYEIYQEVISVKQDANTTTDIFVAKKRALLAQIPHPGPGPEGQQIDFVFGQLRLEIRDKLSRDKLETFDQLLEKAREIERNLAEKKGSQPEQNVIQPKQGKTTHNKPTKRCSYCRLNGHTVEVCRKKAKAEAAEVKDGKAGTSSNENKPKFSCYGCGEPGVIRSRCRKCMARPSTSSEETSFCMIKASETNLRPTVPIKIGQIRGLGHIDTGARSNVASYSLYRQLEKNGYVFEEKTMNITLADGITNKRTVLTVKAPVTIFSRVVPTTFLILPESRTNLTLLGVGFILDSMMVLNIPQMTCRFLDDPRTAYDLEEEDVHMDIIEQIHSEFDMPKIVSPMQVTPVKVGHMEMRSSSIPEVLPGIPEPAQQNKSSILPGPMEAPVPPSTKPDAPDTAIINSTNASTPKKDTYGPLIPLDLSTPPHKRPRLLFDGHSPVLDALYYDAQESLATYEEELKSCLSPESAKLFGTQPNSKSKPNPKSKPKLNLETNIAAISTLLSCDEQLQLETLLKKNEDVFVSNGKPTTQIEHTIDTGKHKPISVAPYRLSPVKTEVLKKEVSKMLTDGIIEPCQSPWSSPVVMVPKKDGGTRVCIDYRQLNAITTPDAYPLPRIDDLLHNAKPTPYMSTIDLRAGYWQIKVQDEDQIKTCFITPFGMYKFLRMPFGLRNAPATFQRLMDRFRISLSHIKILIYIDDIIVLSTSFEQHCKDLQQVFDRLREYNLTINQEKCKFCCSKVKYLGHFITPDGLEVDPEKVTAITKQPSPRNLKHLLSFLQMCSWYRRFIPNFAKKSEPLSRLTRKNTQWQWKDEQQEAFEALKKNLVTAPILVQADGSKPYIIKTDASSYAIGAVLVQGEGDNEHPVEFASRLLTKAERNYTTTEREALAVVWAVSKFRGYIEGTPITVMTDHQALKWLMTLKTPQGRLARWALQLQAYDITIKYITGKTNVVADSLSRPTCDFETQDDCDICSIVVDLPRRSAKEIRTEQLKDENIKKIIKALEDHTNEENIQYWSKKGYIMNDGLLYRYNPDIDNEECQLVVPKDEQEKVLGAYHDDPMSGHYGVEKTLERITKRYYWKGMRAMVETYIKNCINCQRYKPSNLKPAGLLQTTALKQRFEVVSFDLFGPLPKSKDNLAWIFIIEDCATRWVEMFALQQATAQECARILLDEIILRYGTPRRFISDNGSQFVSSVMQQLSYCLNITQGFTPLYHPETNPVERRNRDLKTQLAILVRDDHTTWPEKLPSIRFAMNTNTAATGFSPAYLTFGRELRTPDDVHHDLRAIVEKENFIPEITPKLMIIANTLKRAREIQEMKEENRKEYVDQKRRESPKYKIGDHVMVDSHVLSNSAKGFTAKLAPRRDGPYLILRNHGPSSFVISDLAAPDKPLGLYHASALRPFRSTEATPLTTPAVPLRKRGRPKKVSCPDAQTAVLSHSPRRLRSQRGRL